MSLRLLIHVSSPAKKRLLFDPRKLTLMAAECKLNNLMCDTAFLTKESLQLNGANRNFFPKGGRLNAPVITHKQKTAVVVQV